MGPPPDCGGPWGGGQPGAGSKVGNGTPVLPQQGCCLRALETPRNGAPLTKERTPASFSIRGGPTAPFWVALGHTPGRLLWPATVQCLCPLVVRGLISVSGHHRAACPRASPSPARMEITTPQSSNPALYARTTDAAESQSGPSRAQPSPPPPSPVPWMRCGHTQMHTCAPAHTPPRSITAGKKETEPEVPL